MEGVGSRDGGGIIIEGWDHTPQHTMGEVLLSTEDQGEQLNRLDIHEYWV